MQLLLCGCQKTGRELSAASTETALTAGPAATNTAFTAQATTEPTVSESLVVQPKAALTEVEGVRFYMDTDIIRDIDEPFVVSMQSGRSDFVMIGQLYTIER